MFEIAIRVVNQTPKANNQDLLSQEGTIICSKKLDTSKNAWDQMVSNGRKTSVERSASNVLPSIYAWPWGTEELKRYLVILVDDSGSPYTDDQIADLETGEETWTGLYDEFGRKSYKVTKKNRYTVGLLSDLTYYSNTNSNQKKFSLGSLTNIKNQGKTIPPRYDKPISADFIKLR